MSIVQMDRICSCDTSALLVHVSDKRCRSCRNTLNRQAIAVAFAIKAISYGNVDIARMTLALTNKKMELGALIVTRMYMCDTKTPFYASHFDDITSNILLSVAQAWALTDKQEFLFPCGCKVPTRGSAIYLKECKENLYCVACGACVVTSRDFLANLVARAIVESYRNMFDCCAKPSDAIRRRILSDIDGIHMCIRFEKSSRAHILAVHLVKNICRLVEKYQK